MADYRSWSEYGADKKMYCIFRNRKQVHFYDYPEKYNLFIFMIFVSFLGGENLPDTSLSVVVLNELNVALKSYCF